MKKLLVYLDEEAHEDLKELAHRKKTTMAALVRYALDKTFEDDLDDISSARAFEEMVENPSGNMTLDEYMERRGLALPHRTIAARPEGPGKVAKSGSHYRA